MPLAQITRGVSPATMNSVAIPEIGAAPLVTLSDTDDIHFGMNLDETIYPLLYADLDRTVPKEDELVGLGPRTIDIKRRGGRTAEDDWENTGRGNHAPPPLSSRARPQTGMDPTSFTTFNQALTIKNQKRNFPVGASISGKDKTGRSKYTPGAITKDGCGGLQKGTRWSKTALESALASGGGMIHFHLTGMGDLAGPLGKTGAFSHNVTSRELRYVKRFWNRFQNHVIFYNGYNAALRPVIVEPPWIPAWQPNTVNCNRCNKPFSRAFPIRWPHHCRLCGSAVCDDCSPDRVRLTFPVQQPGSPRETGPVRVCRQCFLVFSRGAPSHF